MWRLFTSTYLHQKYKAGEQKGTELMLCVFQAAEGFLIIFSDSLYLVDRKVTLDILMQYLKNNIAQMFSLHEAPYLQIAANKIK